MKEKLLDENTCHTLCLSLAFKHRQDTGNSKLFNFSKDQLASGIFKVQHAQLLQALLVALDYNSYLLASKNLLIAMKELLLTHLI
jgi:hypothetical protein